LNRSIARRELLKRAAVAATLGLAAGSAEARLKKDQKSVSNDPTALPIIDTHQHLWDLTKFHLSWLDGAPSLNHSYLTKDYLEATKGLNVVRTVYMEVDVDPEQQAKEAEYVIGLCHDQSTPTAAAVISGRPGLLGFREHIRRFRTAPEIKGIRQVLHGGSTPRGYCLEPSFVKDIQFLGEQGMSFDLCMRSPELRDGTHLIDQCPGTRFILDHCGNPNVQSTDLSQWKRDLAELAERPNVVGKVSGILASAKPNAWTVADIAPIVNHMLDSFGPDRVIFAGDWPVCTLGGTFKTWTEGVKEVVKTRSPEAQRKLFHDNAVRFYSL
jgi:predicted TIM-barrel fold metal-dependent hydrolase